MKTKNFKFKSMALVLFALVLSSNVWGETYTKVTSVTDGVYIIVNEASSRVFNGVDAANGYVGCTISDGVITSDDLGNCEVTIEAMTGGYSIKINNGDKAGNYIYGKSGSNSIQFGTTAVANEITFTDGAATILSNSTSFRYNAASGNDRFRYYKTTTTGDSYILPALYKKGASCTNKVTVTKNSATGGTYTLKAGSASGAEIADEGTVDNCDANATIVVVPNANSNYHCTGVTASNSTSVTGPDGSGNYTITYTQGSSISSTINVEFAEDPKHTISFLDNIQLEDVASKEVYDGATFNFPVLTDKTATTTGTCEQVHYHFMGWVISTHTGDITDSDIKTGTSDAVNAPATYKAVWAAEEQE